MRFTFIAVAVCQRIFLCGIVFLSLNLGAQVQVVVQTNRTIRVMASNLSSGNFQRYETPGLDILQGLKPDIVCMQEFNCTNSFGVNTPASISNMVATTFGTNFFYFRESGYNIPNGIISRFPMIAFGSWTSDVSDRGYAWAQLDLPGTNDLYIVSVHLKASSGSAAQRASEAATVKSNIFASFPTNAWVIIAGDMNLYSETEGAITTFKTFLSDEAVPADQLGGTNTNEGRSERYDRVLPSFSMTNLLAPVVLPSHTFTNGLVFVSTNYTPLSDVMPVQYGDSYATGMQHMGVIKDFNILYTTTNLVNVPQPFLTMVSADVIGWQGISQLIYTVQAQTNLALTGWLTLGTATSSNTDFFYTNSSAGTPQLFYRVTYP